MDYDHSNSYDRKRSLPHLHLIFSSFHYSHVVRFSATQLHHLSLLVATSFLRPIWCDIPLLNIQSFGLLCFTCFWTEVCQWSGQAYAQQRKAPCIRASQHCSSCTGTLEKTQCCTRRCISCSFRGSTKWFCESATFDSKQQKHSGATQSQKNFC